MADQDTAASVSRGMRAMLADRDAALAAGASPVGWKIGFDTPAIQAHFGLSEAVVGYMTDTGVSADGATVSLAGWGAPAVEVEVAIRVGDEGAVAGLAPALELVDLDISFDDIEPVLAGNICHRGVIFGDEVPGVDPWAMVATVTTAGDARGRRRADRGPGGDPVVRALLPGGARCRAPGGRPRHCRVRGGAGHRRSRRRARRLVRAAGEAVGPVRQLSSAGSPAEDQDVDRVTTTAAPLLPALPTASHVLAVGHAIPSSATGSATVCSDPGAPPETLRKTPCAGAAPDADPLAPTATHAWLPGAHATAWRSSVAESVTPASRPGFPLFTVRTTASGVFLPLTSCTPRPTATQLLAVEQAMALNVDVPGGTRGNFQGCPR